MSDQSKRAIRKSDALVQSELNLNITFKKVFQS